MGAAAAAIMLLAILLLRLHPSSAASYHNVSMGSSLVAGGAAKSWPSPSGDFAFGFVPSPANSSLFLLAVFFPKTSNTTIVWTANGDAPVAAGSTVQLTTAGYLSLSNATGANPWVAGDGQATAAAMLDTGNFVLVAADGSTVVWETFSNPTDTILPSQVLDPGKANRGILVRSRLSADDLSGGRFALAVQTDGNLVMYEIFLPSGYYEPASNYYASGTVGTGSSLVFNTTTGAVYFTLKNASAPPVPFTSNPVPAAGFYQRATLDPDGVFRQYSYPRNGGAAVWTDGDYTPADMCSAAVMRTGTGACGINSYCQLVNQKPQCGCPPMFSFLDQNNKQLGCVPDFPPQSCDSGAGAGGMYEMMSLPGTDFPLGAYTAANNMNEEQCGAACLADCFCGAAVLVNDVCYMKNLPLSNGIMNTTDGSRKALFKVLKSGATSTGMARPSQCGASGGREKWVLLAGVLPAAASFVLFVASALIFFCAGSRSRGRGRRHSTRAGASMASMPEANLQAFTYAELDRATDKFRNQIGKGAFGTVYEGFLEDASGGAINYQRSRKTRIAVKKLDKPPEENEKEFMAEVGSIGKTHHKNLVRLVGFCNEAANKLLVYEYVTNGSLTNHLFVAGAAARKLGWVKRVEIAVGIARGLLYLHEECGTQIVHCDIKSQNVLLDDEFAAKISDFGMAKLLRHDQTRTETVIRGTRGYLAPEWFKATAVTARVDVYSFGVLLLEIVCCRRNLEMDLVSEEQAVLVDWAYDCYRAGRVQDLLAVAGDGDGAASLEMGSVERMVMVALWCIQEDPARRPTMRAVNQMLDGAAAVPVPPDPSS